MITSHNCSDKKNHILYFDCFSGLSGDMIVAALIDLGVPFELLEQTARALPISGYLLRTERVERHAIHALRFVVDVNEEQQPHRHYSEIRAMIEQSDLPQPVRALSVGIFSEIARAEARVHGTTVDHVHFHEVGAIDSIVDIVCAAAAIHHLNAEVVCAPIPLGTGFVETRHGTLPVPAPATLIILEGAAVIGTDVVSELTTPTGAAIAKATATRFGSMPAMIPVATGFGAGTRTIPGRPGVLRAVLGQRMDESDTDNACSILEANIDDMSGEIAAFAAQRLFDSGAIDVWVTPIQMKKGRPAIQISALCRRGDRARIGAVLLSETTSIGLRHYAVERMEMNREIRPVTTPFGDVRVKISRGANGAVNVAPEFSDCAALAASRGVPLKQIMSVATGIAWKTIGGDIEHSHEHGPNAHSFDPEGHRHE